MVRLESGSLAAFAPAVGYVGRLWYGALEASQL